MDPLILTVDPWLQPAELARHLPGMRVERRALPVADTACVGVVTTNDLPFGVQDAEALPGLRVVVTASVGHEHLDVEGLAERGIATFYTPAYCSEEVADHAFASAIALWRGIPRLDGERREGSWDPPGLPGVRRIAGSTLGIVGLGRIGRGVAARARALGIDVLGYDPLLDDAAIRDAGATPSTLDDLLAASHAVTLHVPLTPATDGLIGARELALMPRWAVLVNVSRAALVDLAALAAALREGRLGAAAFDVWEEEPPAPDDARLSAPNLLLTPHIAWASQEAEESLMRAVADALRAGLEGRPLVGRLRP
jgi:D-3-phosphoglycerate dehydrogenase / 2-oxoglutarate reductase